MRGTVSLVLVASLTACGAETVSLSSSDSSVDAVSDAVTDAVTDARVDAPQGPYVTEIVSGLAWQYALMSDGTVRVRGDSVYGTLGIGGTHTPAPVTIPGLTNIAEVVTELVGSTCARSASGTVWCWGYDYYATLGVGLAGDETCGDATHSAPCRLRPTRVPGLDDAVSISMGLSVTCAARRDGTVWCWGDHDLWALRGRTEYPTRVEGVSDVVKLWNVGGGWLLLHRDGHYSGAGLWEQITIPTGAVIDASDLGYHVCYRLGDGTARCVGQNPNGELGNGSSQWPARVTTPVDPGLSRVRFISSGGYSTCAVTADGLVRCWGDGAYGGLGFTPTETCVGLNHPTDCATRPGPPVAITDVERVFVANWSACALRRDHQVWCWGSFAGAPPGLTRIDW